VSAAGRRAADLAARMATVAGGAQERDQQAVEPDSVGTELRGSARTQVRVSGPAEVRGSVPADSAERPQPRRTPATAGPTRVKPVRVTVELQPIEHRELRRLCARFADEIGVAQVAGAEVFRALLEMVRSDEELVVRLGGELAKTGGSRRRFS
jgi:hypothetical protein